MSIPAEQMTGETPPQRHLEAVPPLPEDIVTVTFASFAEPVDPKIVDREVIRIYLRGQYKIATEWVSQALLPYKTEEIPAFKDLEADLDKRISVDNCEASIYVHLRNKGLFETYEKSLRGINHPIMQLDQVLADLKVYEGVMTEANRRLLREYLMVVFLVGDPYQELGQKRRLS